MKYDKSKITIIVPAKNEGEGLRKILSSIKKYAKEIIVVDGHSKDDTKEITLAENTKYILDAGIGRGEGVRRGLKRARGEIIVLFDADGSPPEKDIPKLVLPLLNNQADLVVGSRRTGGSFDVKISLDGILRAMGCDFLVLLVNKKFKTNLTDLLFSYRAIKKSIISDLKLQANGFDLEQEMIVEALKKGYRVSEIPIRENARKWGKSKLNTITGVKLLFLLVKQLYF